MSRLLLLRHGLTPWNAERRFQGQVDIPLDPVGHRQAAAAASELARYGPVRLWCSDLSRARQTAEHVASATGLELVFDERLREIHVGSFEGRLYWEVRDEFGPEPWDYEPHGGESEKTLAARVAACLADLAATVGEDETAVVVSHGHALRAGTASFLGLAPASVLGNLVNCGWIELTRPAPQASWKLAAYNRVAPIS